MLSRLKSFIRTVWNQVTAALQVVVAQLRITDIASRWTPRLLNRIPAAFGTSSHSESMKEWCKRYGNHPGVVRWLKDNPPPAEWQGTAAEWAYTEMPLAPRSPDQFDTVPTSERVSLLKRIYPRTAAGLGLWAWGQFSPGKPSTLVVGGSPALGVPDRLGEPRLAILA